MRMPPWLVTIATWIAVLPFGWALGLLAALVVSGPHFGQLPAMTVPLGIVAAIGFARSSRFTPGRRLAIMVVGTVAIFLLGSLLEKSAS